MPVSDPTSAPDPRRSLRGALLLGIGVMAAIDEIVFHQWLAWHHLYDRSTPAIGLLSDGLLHSAELILFVLGFFMLLDARRNRAFDARWARAGFFLGLGGFELFDGIVDHKVLRLHQIRYVPDLWRYDLGWNAFALALLVVGVLLLRRARAGPTAAGA